MSTVADEVVIDATIQTVWTTIMDPGRLGDWVTIHRSVDDYPKPPLRKGATMEQRMSVRGVGFTVHWRLAEIDAPHHARWEGEGPARSDAIITYELSEESGGMTRFRYTNEFRPPGGRLGMVAGRFIVGATSEHEARASLSKLKALLENG